MREIESKCRAKGLTWVGGAGPTDAKIAIVGESLGESEEW
jgi:hypothetical protein